MRIPAYALLATVATLAAFAFPGSAEAKSQRMTFDLAVLIAQDHWKQRDVTVPCTPRFRFVSEQEMQAYDAHDGVEADMRADMASCTVLISPRAEWYRTDPAVAWIYCEDIAHELGHFAGLDHDYGGVMSESQLDQPPPFGCEHPRQWAALQGWRKPPRWVQNSPRHVRALWLDGRVWQAQVARARWLTRR